MGEGKVVMERDEKGRLVKGHRTWSEGKKLPETSLKIKELWRNSEYRARQVKAHKHRNPTHSLRMKKLWENPHYQEIQRIKHCNRKLSDETKRKISKALRRIEISKKELKRLYLLEKHSIAEIAKLCGVSQTPIMMKLKEYGIKLRTRSLALKGKNIPKAVRRKISKTKKGQRSSPSTEFKKGFNAPKEWRNLWSKIMKNKWNDLSYVKKIMKARHTRPNNPENRLIRILNGNNLPFSYTGDGKVIVGGLCPDFAHNNGKKKLIELFGRIYHDPNKSFKAKIPWHSQYWGRIAYYSQLGYDCLIIWDDELEDEEKVVERIKSWA